MTLSYLDSERLIHSTKTAIAVLIGTTVARLIGPPADQWVVITIIVVMCAQIYVGSVLRKAYFRFLGTVIGCLLASATLLTVGHSHTSVLVTITLTSFMFSYFAASQEALAYAGTLGAVTTAIILLGQAPTLFFAAQRFLEISLGLFIAALVSQFVLPIHASKHLMKAQAATLRHLLAYYRISIKPPTKSGTSPTQQELDEAITQSLTKQRSLAKESSAEPLFKGLHGKRFMDILHSEREMFRAINMMHAALLDLQDNTSVCKSLMDAEGLHEPIIESLSILVSTLESAHAKQPHIHLPSLTEIDRATHHCTELSQAESVTLDAFIFSIKTVLTNLEKLAHLYDIHVRAADQPAIDQP